MHQNDVLALSGSKTASFWCTKGFFFKLKVQPKTMSFWSLFKKKKKSPKGSLRSPMTEKMEKKKKEKEKKK